MKQNWKKGNFVFTGTAQTDRSLYALMPENLRVDARELPGFLSYVYHVAQMIRYYKEDNEDAGNWAGLLEKDPSVYLALMLDSSAAYWDNHRREAFTQFYTSGLEGKKAACFKIIQLILEMGLILDYWYVKSKELHLSNNEIPVYNVLEMAINPNKQHTEGLALEMQAFQSIVIDLKEQKILEIDQEIIEKFNAFDGIWKLQPTVDLPSLEKVDSRPLELENAMEAMRPIFQRLHFTMTYLEERAPGWFRHSLEHYRNHEPHTGLLLTFLQLMLHLRDQLNEKPRQHLNHYYQDLLHQQFIPHIPDRAIVSLQLADHIEEYLLEKNTALSAGVNEDGIPSNYFTTENLLVTKTRVASLKTVFVAKSDRMKANSSYKLVSGIYAAPIADSKDGVGGYFKNGDRQWPVFGAEQAEIAPANRNMIDANIGFVIASPVLLLQEGDRSINLHFQFTPASMPTFMDLIEDISRNTKDTRENIITDLFKDALLVDVTTAQGWFRIKRMRVDATQNWEKSHEISLSLYLSEEDPAIVNNLPEILGEYYDSNRPLVRILLNPDADKYLYSFIVQLELDTIRIVTRTTGMKALTLRSNGGLLDASSPFMPFGPVPAKNAYLLIGNAELFCKRLSKINFNLEWNSVPELAGGFTEYYKEYEKGINNHSFKVKLSALSSGNFSPADPAYQDSFRLFDSPSPDETPNILTQIEATSLETLRIRPDYNLKVLPEYAPGTRTGYFKLQLHEPEMAFGHMEYPRMFTRFMLSQTKSGGLLSGASKVEEPQMPREPFVPVINRITVAYEATTLLNLKPLESNDNDMDADEKIFTIHPFGTQLVFSHGIARERALFPQLDENGYLFIGLENAVASKPVSLFFNIKESKFSGRNTRIQLFWSYLKGDQWEPITHEQILYDTTRGFTTTGIVKLYLPDSIDDPQTVLPQGLFWLRVAASGNLQVVGQITDVQVNAVEAVWEYNGDNSHFNPAVVLPPIENLAKQRSEIAGLVQVSGFTNGRGLDQWEPFYVRTSERLRHKNRGINIWDIERLVLEAFPGIRRAKCVTWMEYDQIAPGSVKVVVVPKFDRHELEPKVGFHQLEMIQQFLQRKMSPFVHIKVINPVYEKIKITCSVVLDRSVVHEKGKYLQLLQEEILHFICPWLIDGAIQLGGSISKNDLWSFIKERSYVRFLTRFSLIHIFQDEDDYEVSDTARGESTSELLHASTPWSILTPVSEHLIRFIDKEEYALAEATAIEEMRLGTDFIILEKDAPPAASAGLKILADADPGDDVSEWYLTPE